MSEAVVIVCPRVAGGAASVPGSTRGTCSRCRRSVWLAPSSRRLLAGDPPPAVVCVPCMEDDKPLAVVEALARGPRPDQVVELEAARRLHEPWWGRP